MMYPASLLSLRPWRWDPVMTTCCTAAEAVILPLRKQQHLSHLVATVHFYCTCIRAFVDFRFSIIINICPFLITVYREASYRGSDTSPTTPDCCKAPPGAVRAADPPHQASVGSSPSSVRSPLLRQRRVICYEDEPSDDETGLEEDNGPFSRLLHGVSEFNRHHQEEDSGIVVATSSLEVDDESQDSSERQIGSEPATPLYGSSLESEDGSGGQPGAESPFMPIRCMEHNTGPAGGTNLGVKKEPHREGQEFKRSPKLEHKAVTRVKSMMSIECPNPPQRVKGEDPPSVSTAPAQGTQNSTRPPCRLLHCKKGESSDLSGVCTIETIVLQRGEMESFGLDLEIKSAPLRVLITGLRPGGVAERVGWNVKFLLILVFNIQQRSYQT